MGRRRRPRSEHRPLSISASHWRSDGSPKVSYPSEAEARSAAQHRWVVDGVDLGTYPCDVCGGWHMGRSSDR